MTSNPKELEINNNSNFQEILEVYKAFLFLNNKTNFSMKT